MKQLLKAMQHPVSYFVYGYSLAMVLAKGGLV